MGIPILLYQQPFYQITGKRKGNRYHHYRRNWKNNYHPEQDSNLDLTQEWRSSLINELLYTPHSSSIESDDSNTQSFPIISNHMKQNVYISFLDSKDILNLNINTFDIMDIPIHWSLTHSHDLFLPTSFHSSLNIDNNFRYMNNFNQQFLIYYKNRPLIIIYHEIHLYDSIILKRFITILDLSSILNQNDQILSIDCMLLNEINNHLAGDPYNLLLVLGLHNRNNNLTRFYVLDVDSNGVWSNLKIFNLSSPPSLSYSSSSSLILPFSGQQHEQGQDHVQEEAPMFLNIYAGLLPNYIFSIDSVNGPLITDISVPHRTRNHHNPNSTSISNANIFKISNQLQPSTLSPSMNDINDNNNNNNDNNKKNNNIIVSFPQLYILKNNETIYYIENILNFDNNNNSNKLVKIKFQLRFQERILSIEKLSNNTNQITSTTAPNNNNNNNNNNILIVTNQRFFSFPVNSINNNSISSSNANSNSNSNSNSNAYASSSNDSNHIIIPSYFINKNTILYKMEQIHNPIPNQEQHERQESTLIPDYHLCSSNDGKYIFITENHNYSFLLSIFKLSNCFNYNSMPNNNSISGDNWVFLGFIDLKTLFNINQVLQINFHENNLISIMTNDNNNVQFYKICEKNSTVTLTPT
ncbi:Yig1p NDAI_0F01670 [Naumovozyma dairenensis CBS 421]|uniref:Uncharacterized protein n=1 Tax=Naumovozyma dairenensis (strain ATCC 10597 / BCRC 20456 / CBS 421 / NBRC 0211 / NRRL Y-12639) TaxID=1071378 RepID=G0WCH5_NAUDC|nr:hypothetical protein NDAI_0F01670 [Naumovozyma dairenensis CBS 421]CCD25486.1 hypothetical protein NDAI_0F01670 [Naumovozyma dairenensis CBS 421]